MDEIFRDYERDVSIYNGFSKKLKTLVSDLLAETHIRIHSVSSRPKSAQSLRLKVARADGKYGSLADITDVVGVRVITYFEDDVDRVAAVVRDNFQIDLENSTDKREAIEPDRFGYLSLHFVVSMSEPRASLPEFQSYRTLKAEIQIRSILQHAWAEIEHDLGYKTAAAVPREIRRQFSRLAGILELVDQEFLDVRNALARYEESMPRRIADEPNEVLIDKASLRAFVDGNKLVEELDDQIGACAGGFVHEAADELIERHVAGLLAVGITTIAELETALRTHASVIKAFAEKWLTGHKGGVTQGASIMYVAYVIIGESGDERLALDYLSESHFGTLRQRLEALRRIMPTYEELRLEGKV
jgi:GTP pyrophosphokinase